MILLIVVIYFVILAILELIFILMGNNNKKEYIKLNNLEKLENTEINNVIESNNLKINKSSDDINIQSYIGKFYLESDYGFYTNLDKWYLLESKKLYEFNVPVNIKLIKINEKTDLVYFSENKET